VGGRRLYRIQFQFHDDEEPMYTELPASDLELDERVSLGRK
jgi:hypothetical protein